LEQERGWGWGLDLEMGKEMDLEMGKEMDLRLDLEMDLDLRLDLGTGRESYPDIEAD
jgi:hypothetical protein